MPSIKPIGYARILKDHKLACLFESDYIQVYRLYKGETPHSGLIESVDLIFRDKQIIITGDLHPGDGNGIVSTARYGLGWFSGQLAPGYLAEKFLRQEWVPECALADAKLLINDLLADLEDDELVKYKDAIEDFEYYFGIVDTVTQQDLHDYLSDISSSLIDDGLPGYTYRPQDMELLSAIQKRFAELR